MMDFTSIKKKINVKTFMSQSEALVENTEVLKSGVKRLFTILTKKKKINPETLLEEKKTEEVKKISVEKEKEDKKKGGFDLKPLIPLLAGLGALGAITGLAILDPKMFLKRFAKETLKAIGKLIKGILKTFKKIVGTIGNVFKKIFNAIADNAKKLKNLIDDKLLKPIREAFENAINSKWFKKLRSFFDDIGTSIKNFIKNSAERFKTFADDIFKKIKTFVGDFTEKAIKAFKGILDNIAEKILKPLKKAVKEFVGKANRFIKEVIQNVGQNIAERAGKESFGEVIEVVSDALLKNFDNTVDFIVNGLRGPADAVKGFIDNKIKGNPAYKLLSGTPLTSWLVSPIDGASKAIRKLSKGIAGIGGDIKSAVREVPKRIGGLIDDVKAGNTPVQRAFGFVAKQFDPKVMASRFGKGLDFVKGVGSRIGGTITSMKEGLSQLNIIEQAGKFKDDMVASVGGFIGKLKNSVSNNIQGIVGNIFSGGTQQQIIKQAEPAIKQIADSKPALDAIQGATKKADKVFDLFGPLKKGWKEATGKFDQLFTLAEFAISYGSAIDAQKREAEGGPPAQFMGSDIKGQTMGDAILSVLGAFGGSAIGSALGTQLGATIGGVIGAPVFGVGAAVGAGVGGSLFGFLGSVLGGIIGEDIGKLVASDIGKTYKIPDPFLEGRNLFSTEGASDLTLLNLFGMGEKETPELEPQGGFNAGPVPRSVPMNRDFETLEEYSEIYEADLVIVKQTEIVNRVQKPVTNNSSSNLIILSDSIDSVLNNFRDRSLTQLSYS